MRINNSTLCERNNHTALWTLSMYSVCLTRVSGLETWCNLEQCDSSNCFAGHEWTQDSCQNEKYIHSGPLNIIKKEVIQARYLNRGIIIKKKKLKFWWIYNTVDSFVSFLFTFFFYFFLIKIPRGDLLFFFISEPNTQTDSRTLPSN